MTPRTLNVSGGRNKLVLRSGETASRAPETVNTGVGVRSIRCTYSVARLLARFTFTTNFVFFMVFDTPPSDKHGHATEKYLHMIGQTIVVESNRVLQRANFPSSGLIWWQAL